MTATRDLYIVNQDEDYFNLIYSIFNRFCTNEYKPSMKLDKKGYKHMTATLATMALPCLLSWNFLLK